MGKVTLQFLGSGDAFGHGGSLQPCLLVNTPQTRFLLDCGATAMISLHRFGVEPNSLDMVLVSHLHGDHFGGLPFFILDAQLHSKRTEPLIVAGPAGTPERLRQAMEVNFPGSSGVTRRFELQTVELEPDIPWKFRDVNVHSRAMLHPSGAPALAFRLEAAGRSLAYTADTAWTDDLIPLLRGADLVVAEAYFYDKPVKYHLNCVTLEEKLPGLAAGRVLLTHMSRDMLERLPDTVFEGAYDGLEVPV